MSLQATFSWLWTTGSNKKTAKKMNGYFLTILLFHIQKVQKVASL